LAYCTALQLDVQPVMSPDPSEEDLRLAYLDWCSTRVAKRFLELSHDEVWVRSTLAASPDGEAQLAAQPSGGPALAVDRIPGYLDLVRRTALLLADELDLPPFDVWKQAFLDDPAQFRKDMLNH
jgi:hypothetical protein